jgi:hypothetical protein
MTPIPARRSSTIGLTSRATGLASHRYREEKMNEDVFNMSLRKFLKKVGITGQRSIEVTVRDSVAKGRLKGNEKLPAKVTLTLGRTDLNVVIDGEIELG